MAVGAIVRHVVGAMFATGALFVAVRLAVAQLRPYLLPPLSTHTTSASAASLVPWTILVVQKTIDPLDTSELLLYHPSDRFWTFEGIEAAIFVGLALALLTLTLWWMRHRIA